MKYLPRKTWCEEIVVYLKSSWYQHILNLGRWSHKQKKCTYITITTTTITFTATTTTITTNDITTIATITTTTNIKLLDY